MSFAAKNRGKVYKHLFEKSGKVIMSRKIYDRLMQWKKKKKNYLSLDTGYRIRMINIYSLKPFGFYFFFRKKSKQKSSRLRPLRCHRPILR